MTNNSPVALITGASKRIGREIALSLHTRGCRIVIHYHQSAEAALELNALMNGKEPASAVAIQANLDNDKEIQQLARKAKQAFGRVDILINNASRFYPDSIGAINAEIWDDLTGSNLKTPLFLSQALASELRQNKGCIINLADIYGHKPLKSHTVYSVAKAGNMMLTKSLALELAPDVRVNGVCPGAIIWPENASADSQKRQAQILENTLLGRKGEASDIASTVTFLALDAPFINGQIIHVDGGRKDV